MDEPCMSERLNQMMVIEVAVTTVFDKASFVIYCNAYARAWMQRRINSEYLYGALAENALVP